MKLPHWLAMGLLVAVALYAGKKFGGMLPSIPFIPGT